MAYITLENLSRVTVTVDALRWNLEEATGHRDAWELPPEGHEARPFIERAIQSHQDRIDAIEELIRTWPARRMARDLEEAARTNAARSKAAQCNSAMVCYKCDGKGRINAFSYVAGGSCFACKGEGIIRPRRAA